MRLGIFGGAFDPVHLGHLLLAEQCREQCALDEVWFVPTRRPPHKAASSTDPKKRLDMLHFATAGLPQFVVSRMELDRDDVSWTVDTLRRLRAGRPSDELFLLIGADSLRDFLTWREPEEIARLATLVAVNRGDMAIEELTVGLPDSIRSQVQAVSMPSVALSASDIRERVAAGRSIRFMVPRAVEEYIRQHGLYSARV